MILGLEWLRLDLMIKLWPAKAKLKSIQGVRSLIIRFFAKNLIIKDLTPEIFKDLTPQRLPVSAGLSGF